MPHQRKRLLTATILKKLKLWPVLGVIGPRQCGKSTLLREIIANSVATEYFSMDSENLRKRAERSPESFSEPIFGKVVILDEVQKIPALFDAVKLHVDQRRRPGTFILSGSTQFSRLAGVRESLTGRIGILQLYPFCLSEIHDKPFGRYFLKKTACTSMISLAEFEKKLSRGGMPGFFYLHSHDEFSSSARFWVETTCFRDLGRILNKNFDPELALTVLTELAQCEFPTATEVARKLDKDTRVVTRYLDGFSEILVLKKIAPHPLGRGRRHYLFVDSGLASYLGASRATALTSHVLVEALSAFEAAGIARPQVEYYRSEKRSYVPLLFLWRNERKMIALQISDRESPSLGEIRSLESFGAKTQNSGIKVRTILLNQSKETYVERGIEFQPLRG